MTRQTAPPKAAGWHHRIVDLEGACENSLPLSLQFHGGECRFTGSENPHWKQIPGAMRGNEAHQPQQDDGEEVAEEGSSRVAQVRHEVDECDEDCGHCASHTLLLQRPDTTLHMPKHDLLPGRASLALCRLHTRLT